MNVWIVALLVYLAIGVIFVTAGCVAAHSKRFEGVDFSPEFSKMNGIGKAISVSAAAIIWPVLAYIWLDCDLFIRLRVKHRIRKELKEMKKGS